MIKFSPQQFLGSHKMVHKHVKRCSVCLPIAKMQIKADEDITCFIYHLAKKKKINTLSTGLWEKSCSHI